MGFNQIFYYLYFIFKTKTVTAKIKVKTFAIIIGRDLINTPYTSHKKTPIVNATAHNNETSLVSFVFQAFITCGRRAIVVNVPAANPIIST